MSTPVSGNVTAFDKAIYVLLGLLMLIFLLSLPFMFTDNQARLEKQWQDNGCKMYDTDKMADVPAKCNNNFTDHYKTQEPRNQPGQSKESK